MTTCSTVVASVLCLDSENGEAFYGSERFDDYVVALP